MQIDTYIYAMIMTNRGAVLMMLLLLLVLLVLLLLLVLTLVRIHDAKQIGR